jgi:hypothetical protein
LAARVITLMLLMCLPAAAQASDWYGFVEAGQAKADRSADISQSSLTSAWAGSFFMPHSYCY